MITTLINYFGLPIANASDSPIVEFVGKLNRYLFNPVIILLFAAALVYFLYGVFEFLTNSTSAEGREKGQSHILWGLVGMMIMFGAFAILNLIGNTIGADPNPNLQVQ